MKKSKRDYLNTRHSSLTLERSTWIDHWRDLQDYILPRRGRFLLSNTNKGSKLNNKIIDSTATDSVRILASGLMSGLTNPSRPWFKLTIDDKDLMDSGPVKNWLETIEERMNMVFTKSNLYNVLPQVYEELGVFGTGPMIVEEDFQDIIFCQSFTAGEYMIAQDNRGRPNELWQEFRYTVMQCVREFGLENVSQSVRDQYDKGNYDHWVDIRRAIEPNDGRFDMGLQRDRPFRSVYWECSTSNPDDMFLDIRGYRENPIMGPRWHVTGMDIYGRSQGMDALGDCKQLQKMQQRKLEGLDKWVRPPMKGSGGLKNKKASILPGDLTYLGDANSQDIFEPAFQVNPEIRQVADEIVQVQERIKRTFFVDLFLMLSYGSASDRRQITAREIEERHEEKLIMLGPVLQRLNDELYDPLIDRVFSIMDRNGLIPEPPEELEDGMPIDVEYVSILQQAQKAVATTSMDRFFGTVGNLANMDQKVLAKVNFNDAVDRYADMYGVPASVVNSDSEAADLISAAQEQAAAENAAAQAAEAAKTAKDLSQAETSGGSNVLTDITGM